MIFFIGIICITSFFIHAARLSGLNLAVQIPVFMYFCLIGLLYQTRMSLGLKVAGATATTAAIVQILKNMEIKSFKPVDSSFICFLAIFTYMLIVHLPRSTHVDVNNANRRIARQAIDQEASEKLRQLIDQFPFL